MQPNRICLSVLLLASTLVGCLGGERLEDAGMVCLGQPEAWDTGVELSVEAGVATPVTVVFSTCASGSTVWKEQSCSAEASGGQVTVTSSARTRTPRSMTDDCNWVDLGCGTVTLDEGEHVLVYGEGELAFEVPYVGPTICVAGR